MCHLNQTNFQLFLSTISIDGCTHIYLDRSIPHPAGSIIHNQSIIQRICIRYSLFKYHESQIILNEGNYIQVGLHNFTLNRHSVVDIATGYELDDRGVGVRVPVGSRIFSSLCLPDRLCGPPSLLFNGYRLLFPRG
jgi:hypothetical protein